MTRDEIWNMPAGREMDGWIDKLIMTDEPPGFWLWSTDISAAWQVVEKLKLTITPNNCFPHVKARWCVDTELKGKYEPWLVGAETAPLAICRAALLTTLEE